jgi:hypothetical protein
MNSIEIIMLCGDKDLNSADYNLTELHLIRFLWWLERTITDTFSYFVFRMLSAKEATTRGVWLKALMILSSGIII